MSAITCPNCGHHITDTRAALSTRQAEVYEFVRSCIERDGVAPTYSDIAKALELRSLASVHEHVANLATKGWIVIVPNTKQGIRLAVPT